jgi:copper resistance protein B
MLANPAVVCGQTPVSTDNPASAAPFGSPIEDQNFFVHAELDQFEERLDAGSNTLRWEGEAWAGGDDNRLWLKSEGYTSAGQVRDGDDEALYARAVSSFFDLQAGLRYDLDCFAGRAWGAVGIQGLAPFNLKVAATGYASDGGHYALKLSGSYDLLLMQRLVLEPQVELNGYTRADRQMQIASGWSQIDAGIRLRYEIGRKFAPYIGVSYVRSELDNGRVEAPWYLDAGLRLWF